MAPEARRGPKHQILQRHRLLHSRPETVTDPLFVDSPFFDPNDLLQVKYEMLRRVRVDHAAVSSAAHAFGFSRQAFYEAQAAFDRAGLAGLVPDKPGPRGAHKLSEPIVQFLRSERAKDRNVSSALLADKVLRRFGVSVHARSIDRALARSEKKTPT